MGGRVLFGGVFFGVYIRRPPIYANCKSQFRGLFRICRFAIQFRIMEENVGLQRHGEKEVFQGCTLNLNPNPF